MTVTDQNGCTATGSGQVDEFGCLVDIDLGPDASFCSGNSVVLTLPPGFAAYIWSTGESTQSIIVTIGGEYCVTVVDVDGCQDADCIILTEEIFPLVTCPVVNESSPGANDGAISCDSLSGSIQYLWSNGATTPSITGLGPGEYCVTMTNSNGCADVQCFTVQAGGCQLVVTSIITDVLCNGDSTGSVSVSVENANPPIHYEWSSGDTTATVLNLPEGNYAVTVTDQDECTLTQTYTVNEPDALVISVDSIIDISDIIEFPGQVHITINGGIAPYVYQWTFPDGSQSGDEDLISLTIPGFYTVIVTDANACSTELTVLVELDVAVNPVASIKSVKVYPVPVKETLYVDFEGVMTEVNILGIDGRVQKRIVRPTSNALDVNDLEPGWYIIRFTDGESWYVARMVK